MTKKKMMIRIRNEEEAEFALKTLIQNPVEIELWSESPSGRYILALFDSSCVVFENSPDERVKNTPTYRYIASTPMKSGNDDCEDDEVIWHEQDGCVHIRLKDITVVFDDYAYEISKHK